MIIVITVNSMGYQGGVHRPRAEVVMSRITSFLVRLS